MRAIVYKIIEIIVFCSIYLVLARYLVKHKRKNNPDISIFSVEILYIGILVSFIVVKVFIVALKVLAK